MQVPGNQVLEQVELGVGNQRFDVSRRGFASRFCEPRYGLAVGGTA